MHKNRKHIINIILLIFPVALLSLQSCSIQKKSVKQKTDIKDTKVENAENIFYEKYSKILNINLSGNENKELIKEVSEWLGTPYKYAGNTKSGTDCSGFTQAVYLKVYNISLYRSSNDQQKNVKKISKSELQSGDLVFFITSGNKVSHVGIYINDNKFIHASTKSGVVINNIDEDYYKKTFHSAGRVISHY